MEKIKITLIEEVARIPSGVKFQVKDLFVGWEWKTREMREKTLIGTVFQEIYWSLGVKCLGKTAQNQYIYIKE